ncbi:hypothetical protein [Brevundimonas sp. P7753]|uniref:hypothetical protein n=1 Tax=Brevundimonas sp. P7753 TaxID=2726982 RepID=UPI0015BC03B7|nr:hypothetical protein [Brevundimonas sp. P7753]NWE53321.1 hypothetical protein [Brevundimonas sp. P7753]
MPEKVEHPEIGIDRATFSRGRVQTTASLHLTGGLQALMVSEGWSIRPIATEGGLGVFRAFPRNEIDRFAGLAGLRVIGGDQVSGAEGPLPARFWTPQYGPARQFSPADEWGSIAIAAARSKDYRVAEMARKIAVSLTAAGIRVRDASDAYHAQLVDALIAKKAVGSRFANTALLDLFLDFHSLLSEMASARDYIAEYAGHKLGAPTRVDALNRFEDWVTAESRRDKAADPLAIALVGSREVGAPNAWLGELTGYRNLVLHKTPLAAMSDTARLTLAERQVEEISVRLIEVHIPDIANEGATCEALTKFVSLHERLLELAGLAADQAGYSAAPPSFVVRG